MTKGKVSIKKYSNLPGFNMSIGFTIFYVSILLLIPLSTIFFNSLNISFKEFIEIVTNERVIKSYKISFGTAFIAAIINMIFGLVIAWIIVRYKFLGNKFIDAIIDIPFALPTAVAGIALTSIYGPNGIIGKFFINMRIKIAFTPIGIIIALIFIGLPFVVRTVQPVLESLDRECEEAALSLGASKFITFIKVIFPELIPSLITGFTLAFARGLGEYGSVVFIAGNIPMKTEIAPLLIRSKLEQYDYNGATAIALILLISSFIILFSMNILQWINKRKKIA